MIPLSTAALVLGINAKRICRLINEGRLEAQYVNGFPPRWMLPEGVSRSDIKPITRRKRRY